MTLNGAIKQLHELRIAKDMPYYYRPIMAEIINVLLTDVQEVRHGRWIYDDEAYPGGNPYGHYDCDQCGESVPHKTNYCPNCGALMDVTGTNVGNTISREQAIDALDEKRAACERFEEKEMDLISREQAIDALDELCDRVCQYSKEQRAVMCGACPLGSAFDVVDNMPSAEKTGRWQFVDYGGFGNYHCTACGKICICNGDYDYCPNCGARMVE